MISHRCSICDRTDNKDATLEEENYTSVPFVEDPDDPLHFICLDCFESIRDSLDEFEVSDFVSDKFDETETVE